MRCRAAALAVLLVACAPEQRAPSSFVSAAAPSVVATPALRDAGPEPDAMAARPSPVWPTLATAGAPTCQILPPVQLGAQAAGSTIVGADAYGAIATWKRDQTVLAIQPLRADGTPTGTGTSVRVDERFEPTHVFAVDEGFVVLLRRWDSRRRDVAWSALVFRRDGSTRGPVDIGLADMDVRVGQALDGRRVGLIVSAAAIAERPAPGRWQTLEIGEDGQLTSTPKAVDVGDLATTTDDVWEPAALDGARGWLVLRSGQRRPEGVFGGVRSAADSASLLRPTDGVVGEVRNAAAPPPPGPNGMIFEALGRPTLVRTHQGEPVGHRLSLEWHGNPVGAIGMNVEPAIFWSGSHFLYPFRFAHRANLLPIDCAP